MAVNLDGLHKTLMRPRVDALLADPEWKQGGYTITSAFRSDAEQAVLYQAALKQYGSPQAAGRWVAPPGKSMHGPRIDGQGIAIDIGVPGVPPWRNGVHGQYPTNVETRVNALMARHGLLSPMEWEDWHFQPAPDFTQPPLAVALEAPVLRTTVHATPAGVKVDFFGNAVPWQKVVGIIPDSRCTAWIAQSIDGRGDAYVYADPAAMVEVSFQ